MNLISFADELVKVGAMRCLHKRASDMESGDPPAGMMDPSAPPPHDRVVPDEAATRYSDVKPTGSTIRPGFLGAVSAAMHPIDRERLNRTWLERFR